MSLSRLTVMIIFFTAYTIQGFTAFTNDLDCGRVGDQLLNVIKTYYLSKRHDVRMLFTPFPYSDYFNFSNILEPCSKYKFSQTLRLGGDVPWEQSPPIGVLGNDTLYKISYYYLPKGFRHICRIDTWDDILRDKGFLLELQDFMKIIKPYNLVELPGDRISVAMHIRRGSGSGDLQTGLFKMQKNYPEKFSPITFFKKSLKELYQLIERPLYVHIFTDDTNPESLVKEIENDMPGCDIVFGYRHGTNSAEGNHLIDDIASMLACDFLIRSKSNFGQVVELCKEYDIVIYPEENQWRGNELLVTRSITRISERAKAKYDIQ